MILYLHHIIPPYFFQCNIFQISKIKTTTIYTCHLFNSLWNRQCIQKFWNEVNDVFLIVSFIKLSGRVSTFRRKLSHPAVRVLNQSNSLKQNVFST